MARRYLTEMLQLLNDEPVEVINQLPDNEKTLIRLIVEPAFDPSKKFVLPEGEPPFKKEKSSMGVSPINIISQLRKLYVFSRADIQDTKREMMFINLLEGIHPQEAEVLLAVKDQELDRLYPKITLAKLQKAGFLAGVKPKRKKRTTKASPVTTKKKKKTKAKKKKTVKKPEKVSSNTDYKESEFENDQAPTSPSNSE